MKRMARHTGFSLIEVLVSLLLVSLGALGVVAYTGKTMQMIPESDATAKLMVYVSQAVEPLDRIITDEPNRFVPALRTLAERKTVAVATAEPAPVLLDVSARDADGNDVLATAESGLLPPYTVTLTVSQTNLSGVASYTTSRVYVP
jgi:prepilin-type N-terminal cleavage/methylation domain-containing protein